MGDTDYKLPISISLPQSIVRLLDKKRGHLARSAYILLVLEKAFGSGAA
jgi:hypothetical protein